MAVQNIDLAQKYLEQNIEIFLLGSPHYIMPSDLQFPNMRLFREMNATITIGPLFCEDEYVVGCVFGFRNETIDLYFKSDNFIFEIRRNFTIYNLNIYANDIVLSSSSLKSCYNNKSICCDPSLFQIDVSLEECGLVSRSVVLNEKSKLNYMTSLFQLRVSYDTNTNNPLNLNQTPIPFLNITNVLFQNFYSLEGESSWLSLIMMNTLGYYISINNIFLISNFFPYGFLISVSLEDDPYYNYLSSNDVQALYIKYPNSNQYNNSIMMEVVTFQDYDSFNFQIAAGSAGQFAPGFLNLFDEQNSNAFYCISDVNLQGLVFENTFYFFSFLTPVQPMPTVMFNNTLMINNSMLGFLNCENANVSMFFALFDQCTPGGNAILNVFTQGFLNIYYATFSNTFLTQTNNFLSATNFIVYFFDTYLTNLVECFAQTNLGNFTMSNCTFFLFTTINSEFMFSFIDSNIKFENFLMLNTSCTTITSEFFYFFSSTNISIKFINWIMQYTTTYAVNSFESSVLLANILVSNVLFNLTKGLRNSNWGHHFFFDCSVGSFNELKVYGLKVRDAQNLELAMQLTYWNSMKFINIDIINLYGLQYYTCLLSSAAGYYEGLTNSILFENMSIINLSINRSIALFLMDYFGDLKFKNCSFQNITFNQTLAGSSTRTMLVTIDDIGNFTVENSYFDFYQYTMVVDIFLSIIVDNVTFINNTFQGKFNNSNARVPAICAKVFINFTFINNSILNMSSLVTSMDIGDETGVVSILASGAYASTGGLLTIVKIIGNYFFGNIGIKYGVIGIVGCSQIEIVNNTFEWGQSYYGGSIAIYLVSSVNIANLIVNNCQGVIGGGVYIYGVVGNFLANQVVFQNVSTSNGGGIYLESCQNMIMQNLTFQNLMASQNGGGLYIYASSNITFFEIQSQNTSSVNAGFIYIESSNVTMNQIICIVSTSSQIGGSLYLVGTTSVISLQNASFIYCSSGGDGAILASLNINNLTIHDTYFSSSSTQSSGNGVINLGGFEILKAGEKKNYGSFILKNISCLHNIAKLGGCVYFSSNNYLILQDVIVSNITGSLFNIESDGSVNLTFNNLRISNSNFYVYEGNDIGFDITNPLLVFIDLQVLLSNLYVENNTAESSLIKITSANVTIINSEFCNFFNTFGDPSVSARFFYISDSSITFENTELFYSNLSLVFCMFIEIRSSNLFMNQSNFHDGQTLDLACISAVDSQLDIINTNFTNLGGTLGTLSCQSSSLNIRSSVFKNNINTLESSSDDQASDIIFSDDTLSEKVVITYSLFYHLDQNSIVISDALNVTISYSQFIAIANFTFSRAAYFEENNIVNLYSCIFRNFQSEIGGALSLYQISSDNLIMNVNIFNCTFFNNTAFFGGGIYFMGSIYLRILSSNFQRNLAQTTTNYTSKVSQADTGKGGCIIADCEYYSNYKMEMNDTNFLDNFAENFGPTLISKSFGKNQTLPFFKNTFSNNADNMNFTNKLSGTPIMAYLLSSNFSSDMFENSNLTSNAEKISFIRKSYEIDYAVIASGQEFNFSMILTDAYGQLLILESKASAELNCLFYNSTNNTSNNSASNSSDYQTVFVDKGTAQANNGILTFSGTTIVMIPNNNISCTINVSLGDSVLFTSTLEIGMTDTLDRTIEVPWIIYVRNCIKGEVLMEDHTCFECLPGTYLFEDPMSGSDASKKCNNCPDNAYCKGGQYISPFAGYWRFTDQTALILECPTSEACMGIGENIGNMLDLNNLTESELISGICNPNYWGNLCFMCEKGYARFSTNANCEACSSLILIYIKMALSFIFIFSYIAMQAKIFSNIDKNDPNLAILMKLLLNHFQTISMITLVNLGWTVDFNFYFSILNDLSFLFQDFFIIDCLVVNINQNLLVEKIIFTVLLPIILSLLMIAIWMISFFILLYRKNKTDLDNRLLIFISEKMRITLLILVFILYPEILRKCFSLLNCLLIDDSDQYTVLTDSPNVECWNGDHTLWVLTVSMPGITVWGFLTPLVILLVLRKYKSKIQNFIFETHQNFSQKKSSISKKKEMIILKTIYLDIDKDLTDKIFIKKTHFPIKNEIKYKKGAQIFSERVEVNIKERKEIIEEMRIPAKETSEELKQFSKMLDLEVDMINSDKLIKDPAIFFDYLNFSDYLKEKTLLKEDLNTNLIRIREEFSIDEKNDENPDDIGFLSIKNAKSSPANKIEQIAPQTFLVIKNLGFIYRGYRPEFYFWETIMFSRKFLLIFIGVFTEFFPTNTKPTMLIIILVGYIYLQIKFKPYQFNYLNKLETYSLVVAFLTGNIGILLFSDFMQSFSVFFLFVIFGINLFYLATWVRYLIIYGNLKEKFEKFSKGFKFLKRRIIKALFG